MHYSPSSIMTVVLLCASLSSIGSVVSGAPQLGMPSLGGKTETKASDSNKAESTMPFTFEDLSSDPLLRSCQLIHLLSETTSACNKSMEKSLVAMGKPLGKSFEFAEGEKRQASIDAAITQLASADTSKLTAAQKDEFKNGLFDFVVSAQLLTKCAAVFPVLGKSLQESKPGFADAANIMKFNDALNEAATTTKNLDQFAKTIAKSLEMRDSLIKNSNLDVMDAELIAKRSNEILKAAGIKGVMNSKVMKAISPDATKPTEPPKEEPKSPSFPKSPF